MAKIYQVFIGCPFRSEVRSKYEKLKEELEAETPLHLVLADTGELTSTNYLLEHITTLIKESAGCVFDATAGNPNVSLEVGIAHALPVPFLLTISMRKPRTTAEKQAEKDAKEHGEIKAIISDLQGKNRIEYKAYPALKRQVLERYISHLPYMKRWGQFKDNHKDMVPYAIQLFEQIRNSGRSQRPRLTAILDGTGFPATEVADALVKAKLMVARRGPGGGYFYPEK